MRYVLLGGTGSLFVSTFLPVWLVWYINPWEGLGKAHSLWIVIWEIVENQFQTQDPDFPVTVTGDSVDLIKAGFAFCIGGFLGAAYYVAKRFNSSTNS